MRKLLIATGHPQGSDSLTGHIGPLPDIRAAIDSLNRMPTTAGRAQGKPAFPRDWTWAAGRLAARGAPGTEAEWALLDASGRRRFAGAIRFGAEGRADLAMPPLPAGIYWLRIRSGPAEVIRRLALLAAPAP